jgi:hypothetical protein
VLGFGAGALSHLIFQGLLGAAYHAAGIIPGLPWSLRPVPPWGVPLSVNLAFWAGLWGVLYAAVEPRLSARFGRIAGGVLFGVAPLLIRWFIILPLKGQPVVEGFEPKAMGVYIGFHLIFGLGLAILLGSALDLSRRAKHPPQRPI